MMTLIIGGSGSGKSSFAEQLVVERKKGRECYYIATMEVYGEEGRKKVERHRTMRKGKGFVTIEQSRMVEKAIPKRLPNRIVLLECLSNLVANEMFLEDGVRKEDEVVQSIFDGICTLEANVDDVVIVSSNVFEDGVSYEEGTMAYIRALGKLHKLLAEKATEVIEVIVGIPVWKKGKE